MSKPAADFTVRSPGRINVIGEHTDYTGGLVMPASIDKSIWFEVRRIGTPEWRLRATDINDEATVQLPLSGRRSDQLWVDYLVGVGLQFQNRGHFLPGLEISFGGNLPKGSGMSSSAALEGGIAFALNEVLATKLSGPELAQLCKRSSNTFLNIPSGIMDQFASLNGRAAGPIVLNCATLEFEPVASRIEDHTFLLVNSMVTHELASSEYPVRVEECATALEIIQTRFPEVGYLSDVSPVQLGEIIQDMPDRIARRARHVVGENERVRRAITAMEAGNARGLGLLLNETHTSLRDDYEVSCAELDFLQTEATEVFNTSQQGGVAGARVMGGGFGGCTINLVRPEAIPALKHHLTAAYQRVFGRVPEFYAVHLANGTELVEEAGPVSKK